MINKRESWDACPPGELQRMVARVQEARSRAAMHRVTSVLAAVLLVSATAWLGTQLLGGMGEEGDFGQLTCGQVKELLGKYGRGELAASLEKKVEAHLEHCEHCEAVHRQMQQSQDATQTHDARPDARRQASLSAAATKRQKI